MITLKNLCLSSCRRQKRFISAGTEINFALQQMLSITLSGHTSCSPKIAKVLFSAMYFASSAFNCSLRPSSADLSSFLTAARLFFLGGALPTCNRDSLPPLVNSEGLHAMQQIDLCCTVPPSELIIDNLKQFSLSVQNDLRAESDIFSVSVVNSK